ncbi:uncharacterized protein LOC111105471 [Crassostrea virginica]
MAPARMEMHVHTPMCANTAQANTHGNSAASQKTTQASTLSNQVDQSNQPHLLKSKKEISTPIKVKPLAVFLKGYNKELASFLIRGFTFGFNIPYQGPRVFRLSKNLSSIKGNEIVLHKRISMELQAKRIAGPFDEPPFPNIQVSPLGLVPKKNPGEFRLIHHLSYPDGNSINCHIPKHFSSVQYQSVDTAIRFIQQLGKGALLAKTDLENAYKQVPIHPDDFELLGFMVEEFKQQFPCMDSKPTQVPAKLIHL